MASFASGLISGYGGQAPTMKKGGMKGLLRKKKKTPQSAPPTPDTSGDYGSGFPLFKRGGKMRKTGLAKLHRGERVLTKKQTKKYERKRRGGKRR